ncbi:type II toxin-antitoxin system RelE/ParE family toxin, partial [Carboxylicivirga marina]
MAQLKVYWTLTAIKQRNHIFAYWNKRNKSSTYSQKLRLGIKERINLIKDNPEIGKPTELNFIRGLSLGHYSILYKQQESRIY